MVCNAYYAYLQNSKNFAAYHFARMMVWYGMGQPGIMVVIVWQYYGMVCIRAKCPMVVWYGIVWYEMVWYGLVLNGNKWYGIVWYGMVWCGMKWYGIVWYRPGGHNGGN